MSEEKKLFMKMRNITLIVGQFDSSEENSIPNSHKRIFRRKRRPADHIKKITSLFSGFWSQDNWLQRKITPYSSLSRALRQM